MKNSRTGSLTLVGLTFLMVISVVVGYQLKAYQTQLHIDQALIHQYSVRTSRLKSRK